MGMGMGMCCCNKFYRLVRCDDPDITICTDEDLSAYVGHTVEIDGDEEHTWTVYETNECESPTSVLPVNDVDAEPCLCYVLTECGTFDSIYSQSDLSAYIGRVIQRSEDNLYYTVFVSEDRCVDPVVVTVIDDEDDCPSGGPGDNCSTCNLGTVPNTFRVTIPGGTLTNNPSECDCCSYANGRTIDCVQEGANCDWSGFELLGCDCPIACGNVNDGPAIVGAAVTIFLSGGHYFLAVGVTIGTVGGTLLWNAGWSVDLGTSKPNCDEIDIDVPFDSVVAACGCGTPVANALHVAAAA